MAVHQQPRSGGSRFIAGDALRGITCLVIVVWHMIVASAQITGHGLVSPGLKSELGIAGPPVVSLSIAVWLFFLLSGYLIGGPFVRAVVSGDGRRPQLGSYARNRVLRIVPAFWVFFAITVLVVGTRGSSTGQMALFGLFGHVYDHGPFTERMVQAWTLDVEVVFYAVAPLVLLPLASMLRGRGTPWSRAGLILAGLGAITVVSLLMGVAGPGAGGRIVPGSAWAFAPGVALATLEPLVRDRFAGRSIGRVLAWALVATSAGAFVLLTYAIHRGPGALHNFLAGVVCTAFVAAPLVWQWTTGGCWRALDNRFLNWVGARAYGIYLVHVLLVFELRHLIARTGSTWAAIGLVLPLLLLTACLAGALSYRFVERPFLERRVPWRSGRAESAAPAAVAVEPAVAPAEA